jgi:hypothetical protein
MWEARLTARDDEAVAAPRPNPSLSLCSGAITGSMGRLRVAKALRAAAGRTLSGGRSNMFSPYMIRACALDSEDPQWLRLRSMMSIDLRYHCWTRTDPCHGIHCDRPARST